MELFAKGKRGLIYKDGNVCVKMKNPKSAVDTLRNEAEFLKILNKKNIGPKFIKYGDGKLYREFVNGVPIQKFLDSENISKKMIAVLKSVLKQCRAMDLLNINKTELTNPYKDIIISDGKPTLIDFERCKKTNKPQNVTQFLQYIARNQENLARNDIIIDKEKLFSLGKDYKHSPCEKTFRKILQFLP
jgi:putative serine/threonine protein kinase